MTVISFYYVVSPRTSLIFLFIVFPCPPKSSGLLCNENIITDKHIIEVRFLENYENKVVYL